MKTCCVTGATGCVGRNLVTELIERGWDVTVLHRASSDLSRLNGCSVRFQAVNLHDLDDVRRVIPTGLSAIFHCAANTSHWAKEHEEQWKDNVLATRNLATAALEKKVGRFIFTSSASTRFFQETDATTAMRLDPPYVRTKRLSEIEVYDALAKGLDAVVLHPIIVVGEYDWNSYGTIFRDVKSRLVKLCFPGRISFCHARDVARAHVEAYERGRRGERYMLGGVHTTWHEFFTLVARAMGITAPVYVAPRLLLFIMGWTSVLVAAITGKKPQVTPELIKLVRDEPDLTQYDKYKAKLDLGYESRPLDVMVRDCYAWLTREKLL